MLDTMSLSDILKYRNFYHDKVPLFRNIFPYPIKVTHFLINNYRIIKNLQLRTALEREGDRFDPSGYAYVTVGEGSNPAALESQDPLASEHPPFDDRKSAEKEKQAAHGAGTSGLRGSQKGKDFLQSSLRNHDEWIENTYATGESIPKKEGGTCTFLDDLSQHISIPIEDESVPCKRLKSKKETIQEVPITPNQDPLKLVAQPLGVDELRAMVSRENPDILFCILFSNNFLF